MYTGYWSSAELLTGLAEVGACDAHALRVHGGSLTSLACSHV